MKFAWYALGLALAGSLIVNAGCGDDTGGSGGSGAAGSSSSASTSVGGGASSSTGSSMMSSSSSSASGSGGGSSGYQFCSDCTDNQSGALTKECKTQVDACQADADCAALMTCWYDTCPTTAEGACCTLKCATDLNTPAASVTKFNAVDQCFTCTTCKELCAPESTAYCDALANPMCP